MSRLPRPSEQHQKLKPRKPPFRVAPIRKGDIHPRTGRVCIGLDEAGDARWGAVDPAWLAARPSQRRDLRPSARPTSYVASGRQQVSR